MIYPQKLTKVIALSKERVFNWGMNSIAPDEIQIVDTEPSVLLVPSPSQLASATRWQQQTHNRN